jgi:hypothetical protein
MPLFAPLRIAVKPPVVQQTPVDHQHTVIGQALIEAAGERILALCLRADLQQEIRPERHQVDNSGLGIGALTVGTTRKQSEMRPAHFTLRYPDRHAIDTQDRQTAPAVGVKLLMSMTCDNGIEQVFERACTQFVAQERHAKHQPHPAFCRELPAANRSGSRRFKGLRHQRSI